MKKIFSTLIILFIFFYLYQIAFNMFSSGHYTEYKIYDGKTEFQISEKYFNKNKSDKPNYSLQIKVNDKIFTTLTYENFMNRSEVIKDLKYYNDERFSCLFIKYYDDKVLNDVQCYDYDKYLTAHNIEDLNEGLLLFFVKLYSKTYNSKIYKQENDDTFTIGNFTFYKNSLDNTIINIYN